MDIIITADVIAAVAATIVSGSVREQRQIMLTAIRAQLNLLLLLKGLPFFI